ncbi:hypothetical protein WJX81_004821 [Elliptochloris bilobata]|uniref:Uncharacterized protein n=1 Tax=Elliptochloris bilobata TaxID=381761 RepID=A0AAW1QUQ6_9CHLO
MVYAGSHWGDIEIGGAYGFDVCKDTTLPSLASCCVIAENGDVRCSKVFETEPLGPGVDACCPAVGINA